MKHKASPEVVRLFKQFMCEMNESGQKLIREIEAARQKRCDGTAPHVVATNTKGSDH